MELVAKEVSGDLTFMGWWDLWRLTGIHRRRRTAQATSGMDDDNTARQMADKWHRMVRYYTLPELFHPPQLRGVSDGG